MQRVTLLESERKSETKRTNIRPTKDCRFTRCKRGVDPQARGQSEGDSRIGSDCGVAMRKSRRLPESSQRLRFFAQASRDDQGSFAYKEWHPDGMRFSEIWPVRPTEQRRVLRRWYLHSVSEPKRSRAPLKSRRDVSSMRPELTLPLERSVPSSNRDVLTTKLE